MENRPKTGRNAELKPCLNCAERYIGCHGRNEYSAKAEKARLCGRGR